MVETVGPEPLLPTDAQAPARTAISVLREQKFGWIVPCFAALLGFLTGWDVGYIGSMLESDSFKDDLNQGRPLSGFYAGLLVGLVPAGAVFSSLPCIGGMLMDKLGRRGLTIVCALVCIVSAIIQATSQGLVQICIGRMILGLSVGCSFVCPVYQSEVAPRECRGAMMSTFPLALTFGIFAATACNAVAQDIRHGWILCVWPMAVFSGILAIGMLWCPESPRHLLSIGEDAKARQVLIWLRSGASEETVEQEWIIMQRDVDVERDRGQGSYKALCSGFMGRLLLVGIVGWMLFHLCGMPAFSYFGPKMFKMIRIDAFTFQMVTTGLSFVVTFPTLWIVDRYGRKPLLKLGAVGMGVSMFGLAVAGTWSIIIPHDCPGSVDLTNCAHSHGLPEGEVDTITQATIMTLSIVFCVSYSMSWGAVINVFGNEIFPLKFRARAVAIGTCAGGICNFCIGQFTPILMDSIQFKTFFIFSVFDCLCFLFACWVPETANLHLEQLVLVFERRLGLKYSPDK